MFLNCSCYICELHFASIVYTWQCLLVQGGAVYLSAHRHNVQTYLMLSPLLFPCYQVEKHPFLLTKIFQDRHTVAN